MAQANPNVVEVTDQTFASAVIDESDRRPVVVDFWADWCQPCRMIGPVLERLAGEASGEWLLAKLDVDANPQAAQAFRIQSIPAVKAFREGRVVNEFIGAIPEQAIRQFVGTLLPSSADRLVEEGFRAEANRSLEEAERAYQAALDEDPKHVGAAVGLARVSAARGDFEDARRRLEPLRPDPEAERLLAALDVSEWASSDRSPDGPIVEAERAAAEGRFQDALETFLAAVRNGDDGDRERAQSSMLKVFSVLGDQDPLTREYRRKLSAALF
jgi:putative thioredoxin